MKIAIFIGVFFSFFTAAQAIDLPAILELAAQNKSKKTTNPSLSTLVDNLSPPHLESASHSFGIIRIPLPNVAGNIASHFNYAYATYLTNAAGKVTHASFLKGFQDTDPTEVSVNLDHSRFFLITSTNGNSPLIIIDSKDFSQQFIAPLEKTPLLAFQGGAFCSSSNCLSISAASNSIRYFRNLENLMQKPIAYRASSIFNIDPKNVRATKVWETDHWFSPFKSKLEKTYAYVQFPGNPKPKKVADFLAIKNIVTFNDRITFFANGPKQFVSYGRNLKTKHWSISLDAISVKLGLGKPSFNPNIEALVATSELAFYFVASDNNGRYGYHLRVDASGQNFKIARSSKFPPKLGRLTGASRHKQRVLATFIRPTDTNTVEKAFTLSIISLPLNTDKPLVTKQINYPYWTLGPIALGRATP